MLLSRPLSTASLKRMFLLVLNEHNSGMEYEGKEKDYRVIVYERIADYFKISDLTVQEFKLGLLAVQLLEKEGLIMQDKEESEFFRQLTQKGSDFVNKEFKGKRIPVINYDQLQEKSIEEVITRFDLRERVLEDYYEGNYEAAIMKAFDLIEEKIKEKTRQTEGSNGVNEGSYNLPKPSNELVDTELKILRIKMFGAVMWFRDKNRDVTAGITDAEIASQILGYANLHLKLIDECEYFT